ncbi:MAG: ERF family protein [Geminicoccaceae bacterium]
MTDEANTTKELDIALVEAKKAFGAIKKKRVASIVTGKGSYKFFYADLADVLSGIENKLLAQGVLLMQPVETVWGPNGEANTVIRTELCHAESGQKRVSEWPVPMQQQPQQTGILISYYRRYALCAALGISAEQDDDRTEADESATVKGDRPVKRQGKIPTNSGKTKMELQAWLKEFVADIHACSTEDELDALINSSGEMISAVQSDLSGWWFGDARNPDYEAVVDRLQRIRKEIASVGPEDPRDDPAKVMIP